MLRNLLTSAALITLAAGLGACGGGGGGGGSAVVTPPAPAAKIESQFGANFATAYQAGPNTEAKDVNAGDTIAVNPAAEPVDLPAS